MLTRAHIDEVVRAALDEDAPWGDLTSETLIPADATATAELRAREAGVFSGGNVFASAFRLTDLRLEVTLLRAEGEAFAPGDVLALVSGPARGLLTAERVGLNFVQRMSGIATLTAAYVAAVAHTPARIVDTRKTTPGLRRIERHAVRSGGGRNHRFSLSDAVMAKDNHLAVLTARHGSVTAALQAARKALPHTAHLEVEIDQLDQLDAPAVTTVNRVFDYLRQEIAEPIWTTGGNPDLEGGRRQSLTLSAMVRPLGDQVLTINLGYRRSVAKGGVAGFPELTPAIEAAFPERVTRDADGRLVAVDARAINLARETDSSLSTGIALRLPGQRPAGGAAVADPLQFSLSLNHNMRLKNELLTRPGVPAIDQLRAGGQSRHSLSFQASAGKRGGGANLSGSWSSPGRLRGPDEIFIFKPSVTLSVSAFVELDHLFESPGKKGILNDLKLSVDIDDLLDGYRRVTREDGTVPVGYSRHEIDPLGRKVRLTLRKKF